MANAFYGASTETVAEAANRNRSFSSGGGTNVAYSDGTDDGIGFAAKELFSGCVRVQMELI